MKPHCHVWLCLAAFLLSARTAVAAEPVVVELFTSQSCSSCPPAEALLGELADRPAVIALEYHVDYWNDLIHGLAGRWRDPFSTRAHTERQRDYNMAIRHRRDVYTPQVVIDGRTEAVGSSRADIERLLKSAAKDRTGRVTVQLRRAADDRLIVGIDGPAAMADVWLVRFDRRHITEVPAGENKGKKLINRHVVSETMRLGSWGGKPEEFAAMMPLADNQGCAVLVQSASLGPILGAALCPMP